MATFFFFFVQWFGPDRGDLIPNKHRGAGMCVDDLPFAVLNLGLVVLLAETVIVTEATVLLLTYLVL